MKISTQKDILRITNKEAVYTLFAYGVYFVWWYATAYGLGGDNPAQYTYILGMPAWFFYSCIVGYPLGCVLTWGLVRRYFTHIDLEAFADEPAAGAGETLSEANVSSSKIPAAENTVTATRTSAATAPHTVQPLLPSLADSPKNNAPLPSSGSTHTTQHKDSHGG